MASLHSDEMSSILGESLSSSIFVASGMCVASCGDGGHSEYCWGLACCCLWAEFQSLARRCICRLSNFVIGGRSFWASARGDCCAIGHIVCACLLYVFITEMTYFTALSICVVVGSCGDVRSRRKSDAFSSAGSVCASPNW